MPMPASVLMRASSLKLQRTTSIQNAWTALIDPSSGYTYYYDDQTGQSQWEVPAEFAQQGGGAQAGLKVVLWRLKGSPYRNSLNELVGVGSFTGVNGFAGEDKSRDYEIDTSSPVVYPLCEGDEQVLSRWNMLELTLTLTLTLTITLNQVLSRWNMLELTLTLTLTLTITLNQVLSRWNMLEQAPYSI